MNWMAFLAKGIYGVKYAYWYHGIPDPEFYPNLYERVYLKLFIFMTKMTVINIDCAVSVSKAAQKEFKRHTGFESRVIYNEVDFKRFRKEVDGSEIRKKHQLGNSPVILNVGRVCPQKGAHLLIEAFKIIIQKIPTAKLVIVGKHTYDYYSKELKEMCDSSVIFTGYVSDEELPQYYTMCDIYATCSLWETFNIPLAEAQACGKSVVAFNIGPHSEVVNENGIIVKVGDVEEFADKCVQKLFELRGDLVEKERKML
jgi:glycosyltransferase involved in cell wall biosynthesis